MDPTDALELALDATDALELALDPTNFLDPEEVQKVVGELEMSNLGEQVELANPELGEQVTLDVPIMDVEQAMFDLFYACSNNADQAHLG